MSYYEPPRRHRDIHLVLNSVVLVGSITTAFLIAITGAIGAKPTSAAVHCTFYPWPFGAHSCRRIYEAKAKPHD